MKKIFLKLSESKSSYEIFKKARTKNNSLNQLVMFLEAWGDRKNDPLSDCNGLTWEWLTLSKMQDGKTVFLWNTDCLKEQATKDGLSKAEQEAYDAAYDEYHTKRWDDMPILYMTTENYLEIVQKWQKIVLEQRPQFIILSQDDAGYVDLVGKDELSEQDLADMKREHEKFLKYQAAYDKYSKSRPDIVDELWHGPESSEYESDWQKFLDEPLD